MQLCAGLEAGAEGTGQRWDKAGDCTGRWEETSRRQATWERTFAFFKVN